MSSEIEAIDTAVSNLFEQKESAKFSTLHYKVLKELDITLYDYAVLDTVFYLSAKKGYCYKSAKSIGYDLNLDKRSIQRIYSKLIQRGLLIRLSNYTVKVSDKYIDTAIYDIRQPMTKTVHFDVEETAKPTTNSVQGVTNSVHNIEGQYRNTIKDNYVNLENSRVKDYNEQAEKLKELEDLLLELIGILGFKARVLPGRLSKLKARLKAYKPDDIKQAAQNIRQDSWMQGDNPGNKRYGSIDYLLRTDEQIDKWLTVSSEADSNNGIVMPSNELRLKYGR